MAQVGRYTIVRKLGAGGMGYVFLAEDPVLGRNVAIKTIRADLFDSPQRLDWVRDRFIKEARHLAQLSHPAIVTMYDVFEQKGVLFIVMEYVDGENVHDILARAGGPMPVDQCVSILRQVSAGLDYAHSRQIVHRDIKPANLLQHTSGAVKLTDFGIAKIVSSATKTTAGVLGTVDYMAPEQILGGRLDGRADQFSLAVVAYRMFTGRRVFEAESFGVMTQKICFEPAPPPSRYNPHLGTAVDAVFERALAKAAADRFATCSEFAAALAGAFSRSAAAGAGSEAANVVSPVNLARQPQSARVAATREPTPIPAPVTPVPPARTAPPAPQVFRLRRWEAVLIAIAVVACFFGAVFLYLARHHGA